MIALLCFLLILFASRFKSKSRLEAENAAPRHQLIVLQRKVRGRLQLTNGDRLFLVQLYRWFPSVLNVITIIRPETLVRWHRAGFRRYWRWKSRSLGGRPKIAADLRALIRRMSEENPLWGAPRIHGASLAPAPADRQHHVTCSPRWTASPLHPSLSFRYTQAAAVACGRDAKPPRGRSR